MDDSSDDKGLQAVVTGIVRCLTMLRDEAALLKLDQTLVALGEAIDTCTLEHHRETGEIAIVAPKTLH